MLHQIAYVSLARDDIDAPVLSDILSSAEFNNTRDSITGVLLYHNRIFFQLIEGERQVVRDLYKRMEDDERHDGMTLMWEEDVDERDFPEMRMGYAGPDEVDHHSQSVLPDLASLQKLERPASRCDSVGFSLARNMYQSFRNEI